MYTKTHQSHTKAFSLLELMLILTIIGFLVLIGLPSYRSYIVRSQIMEGLTLASPLKQQVIEYYTLQGRMPGNDLIPAHQKLSSQHIESIDLKPSGKIVITFNQIDHLSKPTLILTPLDHNGIIHWDCTGGTLPHEYRPQRCQK